MQFEKNGVAHTYLLPYAEELYNDPNSMQRTRDDFDISENSTTKTMRSLNDLKDLF